MRAKNFVLEQKLKKNKLIHTTKSTWLLLWTFVIVFCISNFVFVYVFVLVFVFLFEFVFFCYAIGGNVSYGVLNYKTPKCARTEHAHTHTHIHTYLCT